MTEDKEQLHCYVPADVLDRFRAFIVRKHGYFARGLLSYEVELALRRSMTRYGRKYHLPAVKEATRTHLQMTEWQKAVQLRDRVVRHFIDSGKYPEPPTKTTLPMLKSAVIALTGVSDYRAINRHINILRSNGLIKQVDWISKEYAIIYDPRHYSDSNSALNLESNSDSDGHRAGPPRGVTG